MLSYHVDYWDYLGWQDTLASRDNSARQYAYMHAFEETVKGSGSIPPLLGGGNANLKMYEDSFGVSYGVKF